MLYWFTLSFIFYSRFWNYASGSSVNLFFIAALLSENVLDLSLRTGYYVSFRLFFLRVKVNSFWMLYYAFRFKEDFFWVDSFFGFMDVRDVWTAWTADFGYVFKCFLLVWYLAVVCGGRLIFMLLLDILSNTKWISFFILYIKIIYNHHYFSNIPSFIL